MISARRHYKSSTMWWIEVHVSCDILSFPYLIKSHFQPRSRTSGPKCSLVKWIHDIRYCEKANRKGLCGIKGAFHFFGTIMKLNCLSQSVSDIMFLDVSYLLTTMVASGFLFAQIISAVRYDHILDPFPLINSFIQGWLFLVPTQCLQGCQQKPCMHTFWFLNPIKCNYSSDTSSAVAMTSAVPSVYGYWAVYIKRRLAARG